MECSHVFLARRSESRFRGEVRYYCCRQYSRREATAQVKSVGDVLRTGPSGPDCLQESIRRGLLDRLRRNSNAYRADNHLGFGRSDVPVDLGYAEDQIHPVDDAVGESEFRPFKGVT